MAQDLTANLEALLAKGGDAASLRFALATRYLAAGETAAAVKHAQAAVTLDAEYSAAWKLLGQTLTAAGQPDGAAEAYRRGIEVAEKRGDRQAVNEMRVFLRRLDKARTPPPTE